MSLYVSRPGVPAAKINAYPKRRKKQFNVILFPDLTPKTASFPPDICYQDFFQPELALIGQTA